MMERKKRGTFWKHIFAVTLAGTASKTLTAPLERIKLLQQVAPILKEEFTLAKIYQSGFSAFWRGNAINVFRIIPNSAMRFTIYDKFKQYVSAYRQQETYLKQLSNRLIAGFTTGVFSFVFNYPLDVIRVKITTDTTGIYRGMFDCAKKTLQTQGFTGLYSGLMISSIGIVPFLTSLFIIHDILQEAIPRSKSDRNYIYLLQLLGIGTSASIGACALTYPLDTLRYSKYNLRRRMQINGSLGARREYLSLKDCVKKITKNEGITGFYRGMPIALLRIVPAATIQFSVYDYLKEFIFE